MSEKKYVQQVLSSSLNYEIVEGESLEETINTLKGLLEKHKEFSDLKLVKDFYGYDGGWDMNLVGSRLETDEEFTYTIVGGVESNAEKGMISFNSPLAKQLLGKEEGDEFQAKLPGGVKNYELLEVFYKELEL